MPGEFKENAGGGLFNLFKQRRKDKSAKSMSSKTKPKSAKSVGKSASNMKMKSAVKMSAPGGLMKGSKSKYMSSYFLTFTNVVLNSDALKKQYTKQVQNSSQI